MRAVPLLWKPCHHSPLEILLHHRSDRLREHRIVRRKLKASTFPDSIISANDGITRPKLKFSLVSNGGETIRARIYRGKNCRGRGTDTESLAVEQRCSAS
jgi:hypothetical protein